MDVEESWVSGKSRVVPVPTLNNMRKCFSEWTSDGKVFVRGGSLVSLCRNLFASFLVQSNVEFPKEKKNVPFATLARQ
jgi:hypothetical protein